MCNEVVDYVFICQSHEAIPIPLEQSALLNCTRLPFTVEGDSQDNVDWEGGSDCDSDTEAGIDWVDDADFEATSDVL